MALSEKGGCIGDINGFVREGRVHWGHKVVVRIDTVSSVYRINIDFST